MAEMRHEREKTGKGLTPFGNKKNLHEPKNKRLMKFIIVPEHLIMRMRIQLPYWVICTHRTTWGTKEGNLAG